MGRRRAGKPLGSKGNGGHGGPPLPGDNQGADRSKTGLLRERDGDMSSSTDEQLQRVEQQIERDFEQHLERKQAAGAHGGGGWLEGARRRWQKILQIPAMPWQVLQRRLRA